MNLELLSTYTNRYLKKILSRTLLMVGILATVAMLSAGLALASTPVR